MKRLVEEAPPELTSLTQLVHSAERFQPNPFSKRLVQSRLSRAIAGEGKSALKVRPALVGVGVLLLGASAAAAAGYTFFQAPDSTMPAQPPAELLPAEVTPAPVKRPPPVALPAPVPEEVSPPAPAKSATEKRLERRRAGEDPSQVTEAVRALRKQGDPKRAQALLDQYLGANPRGALAEDALALSIEAAAARKDPRAADYARRYLVRYPNGRFREVAERALSR